MTNKPITWRMFKLKNRRVMLRREGDLWELCFRRLGKPNEDRIVTTRLLVSDEAMQRLVLLYFELRGTVA